MGVVMTFTDEEAIVGSWWGEGNRCKAGEGCYSDIIGDWPQQWKQWTAEQQYIKYNVAQGVMEGDSLRAWMEKMDREQNPGGVILQQMFFQSDGDEKRGKYVWPEKWWEEK
jgi:hypothetical protein